MLTQNMKDVALALRGAPDDTLSKLARQTESYAQNLGMTVLPVTLDFAESVVLDEQLLSTEQTVDAALASGTSLLYLACHTVNSSALTPASGDTNDASADDLRKALNRIDGWTSQLEIGFAHSGVLHVWSMVTDWFDVLEQLTSPRVPSSARFGGGPTGAWETDQEVESARLSDEAAQDLVDELAANDTFRRAATRGERIDAARAVPAFGFRSGQPRAELAGTACRRHSRSTARRTRRTGCA